MNRMVKKGLVTGLIFFIFVLGGLNVYANDFNDQKIAYAKSKINPIWTKIVAEQFGIDREIVNSLKDSGMNMKEAQEFLTEQYTIPQINITVNDYVSLANKAGIKSLESIAVHERAIKYKKDPVWLSELYKEIENWERIDNAFSRYYKIKSKLAEIIMLNSGVINAYDIAYVFSSIYNVDPTLVKVFLENNYNHQKKYNFELLNDIMFFYDIYSAKELNIDIKGIENLGTLEINNKEISSKGFIYQDSFIETEIKKLNEKWPKRLKKTHESEEDTKINNDNIFSVPEFVLNSLTEEYTNEEYSTRNVTPSTSTLDTSILNNSSYSSPFNTQYGNGSELIDPATGTLIIQETDFVLPGKYGMDFSFTRVFNSSKGSLKKPYYDIDTIEYYYSYLNSGSYVVDEDSYTDNDGRVEVHNYTIFSYGSDSDYDGGDVLGTYTYYEYFTYFDENGNVIEQIPSEYSESGWGSPSPDDIESGYDYDTEITAMSIDDDYIDPFGLGKGWTLDLPYVEITDSLEKYVYVNGSTAFKVGSNGYLINMDAQKLRLQSNTSYTYSGTKSEYALSSINGTTHYFDSTGKLIAIKDKFDSYIRLVYANGLIDKIVDTVGRKISFTHGTSSTIVNVYESENSTQILYSWRYEKNIISGSNKYSLYKVVPPIGQPTNYTYSINTGTFTSRYGSASITTLNLSAINKPSGTIDKFQYSSYQRDIENDDPSSSTGDKLTTYRVSQRYSEVPTLQVTEFNKVPVTKVENKVQFEYNGWNTSNNSYSTLKTLIREVGETGVQAATEYWEFDKQHRNILHRITGEYNGLNRDQIETVTTTYLFSSTSKRRPNKVTTTTSLSGNGSITTSVDYIWDIYGNITKETDCIGRCIEYVYDPTFNMLTQKTDYITSKEGKRIIYELDLAKKNVISTKESYIKRVQSGTKSYSAPTGEVPDKEHSPYAYIWTPPGEITSATMKIYWTTCGWGIDNQYSVEYRESGTTTWKQYYLSPYVDGGLFSTTGTRTTTINFPKAGIYDIRIREIEGDAEVKSGSSASGPTYSFIDDGSYIYTSMEYSVEEPGNLTKLNIYPIGNSSGITESSTIYEYDNTFHAYLTNQNTTFTDVDNVQRTASKEYEYDALGRVTKQIEKELGYDSIITEYSYDELNRIISIKNPPHDSNNTISFKTYTYLDESRQTVETNELGTILKVTFDGEGRTILSEWIDSYNESHIISYSNYDSLGHLISTGNANFQQTVYRYDSLGRLIETVFPDNSNTQNWYIDVYVTPTTNPSMPLAGPTGFNNLPLSTMNKIEDQKGNPVYTAYDVLGRVVWKASNPKTVSIAGQPEWDMIWYEYDLYNRVNKKAVLREPNIWDITIYEYELNGIKNLCDSPALIDLPGSTESEKKYEYNARGLLIKEYSNNITQYINYDYDQLGRISKVSYSDGTVNTRYYDRFGNLAKVNLIKNNILESSVSLEHNKRGWITKEIWNIDNETYAIEYKYDSTGNVIEMKYPDGESIFYEHDELGRIKKIPGYFEGPNLNNNAFAYDKVGNLISVYGLNGINTEYKYDLLGRLTEIDSEPIYLKYSYDANGNIQTINNLNTEVVLNYEYDGLNRLIKADIKKSNGVENISYSYDGIGNRILEIYYNLNNEVINQKYYDYLPGNYLLNITGNKQVSYTWGSRGELLQKNENNKLTEYLYNDYLMLEKTKINGESQESYFYDAIGRRVKVVGEEGTTIILFSGNDVIYEIENRTSGVFKTTKYITVNGRHFAKEVKEGMNLPVKYFYHIDILGSIRSVSDITGKIIGTYEYEPFGNITVSTDSKEESHQFSGKTQDKTGLTYFGARYYDSEIGRFITSDPNFDGINWYVYCRNNPLIHIDPNGKEIDYNDFFKNSTIEERHEYFRSISLLRAKSETFRNMYELVSLSKEINIVLRIGNDENSSFGYNMDINDGKNMILAWNPYMAVMTLDGRVVPPIVCLAHEFGHAMQLLDGSLLSIVNKEISSDPLFYSERGLEPPTSLAERSYIVWNIAGPNYKYIVENDCVQKFEAKVGAEMGMNYRTSYEGHLKVPEISDLMDVRVVFTQNSRTSTIDANKTKEYYNK